MSTALLLLAVLALACLAYGLISLALLGRQTGQKELRAFLARPLQALTAWPPARRLNRWLRWKLVLPGQFRRAQRTLPRDDAGVLFVQRDKGNGLRDLNENFRLLYDRLADAGDYHFKLCCLNAIDGSRRDRRRRRAELVRAAAQCRYIFLDDCCEELYALPLAKDTQVINLWHACGAFKKWGYSSIGTDWAAGMDLAHYPTYSKETLVPVSGQAVTGAYRQAMNFSAAQGVVRALGVSRTDVYFDPAFARYASEKLLAEIPEARGKRVILYAPTFRGDLRHASAPEALNIGALRAALGDGWVLLLQQHPFVRELPEIPEEYRDFAFDVTGKLETSVLLRTADVCVTDYSSVMFEFALLGKPLLFFAFDLEDYTRDRGFFTPYEELTPGPVCRTNGELAAALRQLDVWFDPVRLTGFCKTYMSACDGGSTGRILRTVFGRSIEAPAESLEQFRLSVIVPVYRAEQYLRQCLDSIAGQTHQNLEVIVIDDGSPDHSGEICDEYAARDPRFTVLHQQNSGVSAARNAGLRQVTGDYVAFCDSDDYLEPDAYAGVLTLMNTAGADACFHGFTLERENGTSERCPSPKAFFGVGDRAETVRQMLLPRWGYWGILCNKVYAAAALRRADGSLILFDETVQVEEDQVWAVEVLQHIRRGVFTWKPWYHYRYYAGSASNYALSELSRLQTHWDIRQQVTRRAQAIPGVTREVCSLARFNFIYQRIRTAYYSGHAPALRLLNGQLGDCMDDFFRSPMFTGREKRSLRFLRFCIAVHFPGWLYQALRDVLRGPHRGRALKRLGKAVFYRLMPRSRAIVFESFPDFSDNAYWFAKYLAEHTDVPNRYRLVWWVRDRALAQTELAGAPVTCIYDQAQGLGEKLKRFYYLSTAQYLIDCNSFRNKRQSRQIRIHLGHGAPIKYVPAYATNAGEIDLLVITSPYWTQFYETQYRTPPERIAPLGFARNDVLVRGADKPRPRELEGRKLLLWMPTYRQHQNQKKAYQMQQVFPLGIPVFRTQAQLNQLDAALDRLGLTILLRPHPSQNLRVFRARSLRRLVIADDDYLSRTGLQLYELLSMADGLITDYSSVYYDFLLTQKPIALTIEDLEDFTKTFCLALDYRENIAGTYVENAEELYAFLEAVSRGEDPDRAARDHANQTFNAVRDGTACQQLYQTLQERFGL